MKNSLVVGLGALAVAWAGIALGESRLLTFKCGVAGESLTAKNGNDVHYWTSPTNWTDEAGNMAVPMDDDRLFINVKPSNRSACRFDDYNSSVFDAWGGNRSIPYMKRIEFGPKSGGHNVSDCGFRLKSIAQGGEGLVTRGAGSNAFWLSLIALLFWSGADTFSKLGCRDAGDKYGYLKMVTAVGTVMGLHAFFEIFVNKVDISLSVILTYLPVSLFYISSMALGYLALRYIELSISSPICNASGALVVVLCLITDGIGALVPLQLAAVARSAPSSALRPEVWTKGSPGGRKSPCSARSFSSAPGSSGSGSSTSPRTTRRAPNGRRLPTTATRNRGSRS